VLKIHHWACCVNVEPESLQKAFNDRRDLHGRQSANFLGGSLPLMQLKVEIRGR
jgi:hypothetical protein